ncbi:unnamed protein product [Linum trigynum]|uniref:Rhodanese domain-containing protein n=1 Tax=Linum trigynum TaxID=586398 RepID=A0AAV2CED3_9ROSI
MASSSLEKSTSSGAEVVATVPTVDVLTAKSLIESGRHVYLDVRMEEDFKAAHADAGKVWKQRDQRSAEAATAAANSDSPEEEDDVCRKIFNVPYYVHTPKGREKNPEFVDKIRETFKEDDHLIVGCGTGGRSLLATNDLYIAGFKNACNMGGGYRAWEKNGFPTKKQHKEQQL